MGRHKTWYHLPNYNPTPPEVMGMSRCQTCGHAFIEFCANCEAERQRKARLLTEQVKRSKLFARRPRQCRHVWGPMEFHGWEDGTYQVCTKCRKTRFQGERYTYGSRSVH